MTRRIWVSAFTGAERAERLATRRTRSASTQPSRLLARPLALPDRAARAASTASRGSDLPALRRAWRFWRSTSRTSMPARARKRTPARSTNSSSTTSHVPLQALSDRTLEILRLHG
jgi:hypothetical protein